MNMDEKAVSDVVDSADRNKDQKVSRDEWLASKMEKDPGLDRMAALAEFDELDTDSDGFISIDDSYVKRG